MQNISSVQNEISRSPSRLVLFSLTASYFCSVKPSITKFSQEKFACVPIKNQQLSSCFFGYIKVSKNPYFVIQFPTPIS
jgi:hypothetical protein